MTRRIRVETDFYCDRCASEATVLGTAPRLPVGWITLKIENHSGALDTEQALCKACARELFDWKEGP